MKIVDPDVAFRDVGKQLLELSLDDRQLQSICFTTKHRDKPIDEWVMTWAPDIPIETMPNVLSKMRQYALLKFAIEDGPAENSHYVLAALAHISNELIPLLAADQLSYLIRQKHASGAPRGLIPELGITMKEFVIAYARSGENRLLKAIDIWEGFGQHFRFESGLDMTLVGSSYKYLDDRTLSYSTFRNYVAEGRKIKSH